MIKLINDNKYKNQYIVCEKGAITLDHLLKSFKKRLKEDLDICGMYCSILFDKKDNTDGANILITREDGISIDAPSQKYFSTQSYTELKKIINILYKESKLKVFK